MTIKRRILIVCLCLCLLAAIFCLAFSERITLKSRRVACDGAVALADGVDANDRPFKVMQSRTESGGYALLILHKNRWGMWTVDQERYGEAGDFLAVGWMTPLPGAFYGDDSDLGFAYHNLYFGSDAKRLIALKSEALPRGVAVEVVQDGAEYAVHALCYRDPEALNGFDVHQLLLDNDFIAQ